jgi:hypothetical protein
MKSQVLSCFFEKIQLIVIWFFKIWENHEEVLFSFFNRFHSFKGHKHIVQDTPTLYKTSLYSSLIHKNRNGWSLLAKVFEIFFNINRKIDIGL